VSEILLHYSHIYGNILSEVKLMKFEGKLLEAVVRAMEDHQVHLSEAIERELRGLISGLSKKLSEDQMTFLEEEIRQWLNRARRVSISQQRRQTS
jgi:hypothetical protein